MSRSRDLATRNGMNLIIPTSVVLNGGSATVSANGAVTFTGSTDISLNGVFTAQYSSYKIHIYANIPSSTGTNPSFRIRQNGTDYSTGNHYIGGRRVISWATADVIGTTYQSIPIMEMYSGNMVYGSTIELLNPYNSNYKIASINSHLYGGQYGSSIYTGIIPTTGLYDGISILNGASSTGTIRVYGYNNG